MSLGGRILILGAAGVSGRALMSYLRSSGAELEIHGADLRMVPGADRFWTLDGTDQQTLQSLLVEVSPDFVANLAGVYSKDLSLCLRVNLQLSASLLAAVASGPRRERCRVLLVGSAAEYGEPAVPDLPLAETDPLRPLTPYGLSKTLQTELARYFHRAQGLEVFVARTFNILSPELSDQLVVGMLYRQIAELRAGTRTHLDFGPLGAVRDYLGVASVASAYACLLERARPGEVYNVGSGRGVVMRDLLLQILREEGVDQSLLISQDGAGGVRRAVADIAKIAALGWRPAT